MSGPFATPVAVSVPFEPNRNPGYGGVASDIESDNVQDAIEEAKKDALDNDRYILLSYYNGNAKTGRYLEFFPGIDSLRASIFLPVSTRLLTVVGRTSGNNSNATIGFFDLNTSSTVPVFVFDYNGLKQNSYIGTPTSPLATFSQNAQLAIRVISGSVQKPHVYFFLNAAT